MTAVDVEHCFAPALGISEGQRNDVNDADYVRSGKPGHLARALEKTVPRLRDRARGLDDTSEMKRWIKQATDGLEQVQQAALNSSAENEISNSACFQMWCLSAVSVRLIDRYLVEQGC